MIRVLLAVILTVSTMCTASAQPRPDEPDGPQTNGGVRTIFIDSFERGDVPGVSDFDTIESLTVEVVRSCLADPEDIAVVEAFLAQIANSDPKDGVANAYFIRPHLRQYLLGYGFKQNGREAACVEYDRRLRAEFARKEVHAEEYGIKRYKYPLPTCRVKTESGAPLRFRVFPHIGNVPPVKSEQNTIIGRLSHGNNQVVVNHVYGNWALVAATPREQGTQRTIGWVSYEHLSDCKRAAE